MFKVKTVLQRYPYSNLDEVVGLPCCLVFLDHLGESGIAMQFKDKAVLDEDLEIVLHYLYLHKISEIRLQFNTEKSLSIHLSMTIKSSPMNNYSRKPMIHDGSQ